MNSAEDAEVTAINIKSSVAAAPPLPSMATAALGRTSPAVTSASAIRRGYVGKTGLDSRASAARPIVVAASQGIANHLKIPHQMSAYLPLADGIEALNICGQRSSNLLPHSFSHRKTI